MAPRPRRLVTVRATRGAAGPTPDSRLLGPPPRAGACSTLQRQGLHFFLAPDCAQLLRLGATLYCVTRHDGHTGYGGLLSPSASPRTPPSCVYSTNGTVDNGLARMDDAPTGC
eukprot:365254-Chlamydomonas_euryale.AAC.3